MPLTLREILAFDVLDEAAAEVLTCSDTLDRPVRWVHSSEIYEIGPLLSGGELLLTTGLGLAGADAGACRHYVRELAERGVAGVAVEVGRSLPEVPYAIVDEAFLPLRVTRGGGSAATGPAVGQALGVTGAEVSAITREAGALHVRVFNPSPSATTVAIDGRQGWLLDLRGRPKSWDSRTTRRKTTGPPKSISKMCPRTNMSISMCWTASRSLHLQRLRG